MSFAALYPTNFEKQEVPLAVNVFNEKTIAELTGTDSLVMVQNVTKMWHIINVKTPSAGHRLNDPHRFPISDPNDSRLAFLVEIANCFNAMESQYTHRVGSLTVDTRKALHLTLHGLVDMAKMFLVDTRKVLHLTLHGLVDMAKMFLVDKNFDYILLGHFQSDPIEGEYGVSRQDSGGNFYISYEQTLSSMILRRIKLFDKLDMPYSNDHFNDECCNRDLIEKEIDFLDKISSSSDLSEVESPTLYYVSRYVASKLNIGLDAPETQRQFQPSEFTRKVSRGLLKHPTEDLYELAMTLFTYFAQTYC